MRPAPFNLLALGLVFAAFGAYSLYALWAVGYVGIWQAGMASVGAWQLLLDFVLMSLIALAWLVQDARRTGRKAWPFVVMTLAVGSFGPLLYLLLAPRHPAGVAALQP